MPDDHNNRADEERVDVDRSDQLHNWAKKFDATPEQIKDAVQAVGDRPDRVEMHLKGSRASSNASREAAAEPDMPDGERR